MVDFSKKKTVSTVSNKKEHNDQEQKHDAKPRDGESKRRSKQPYFKLPLATMISIATKIKLVCEKAIARRGKHWQNENCKEPDFIMVKEVLMWATNIITPTEFAETNDESQENGENDE